MTYIEKLSRTTLAKFFKYELPRFAKQLDEDLASTNEDVADLAKPQERELVVIFYAKEDFDAGRAFGEVATQLLDENLAEGYFDDFLSSDEEELMVAMMPGYSDVSTRPAADKFRLKAAKHFRRRSRTCL